MTTIATLSPLSSPEERKRSKDIARRTVDGRLLTPEQFQQYEATLIDRINRLWRGMPRRARHPTREEILEGRKQQDIAHRKIGRQLRVIKKRLGGDQDALELLCLLRFGFRREEVAKYLGPPEKREPIAIEPSRKTTPPETSCVYFVECVDHGLIKIGIAVDLKARVRDLQNSTPFTLQIVATIPGAGYTIEQSIHRRFKHLRHRGEWFRFEQSLQDFIRTEAQQWQPT